MACDVNVLEEQEHLSQCDGYFDLKVDKDLNKARDLIEFYSQVMERREVRGWSQLTMRNVLEVWRPGQLD